MNRLIAGVLAGLVLSSAPAVAQERKLQGHLYTVFITNLRHMTESQDAKGVMRPDMVTDTGFAILDVTKDGTLWGTSLIGDCPGMSITGISRMRYPMEGGLDLDSDSCGKGEYEVNFGWTTFVRADGKRLEIEGEISIDWVCPMERPNCEPPTLEVTERAVLRLDGRQCTLDLYEVRQTFTTDEPSKPRKTTSIRVSTPLTRCDIR